MGGIAHSPAKRHNYTMSDIDPHLPKERKYINLISLRSINIAREKITFWQYFFAVFPFIWVKAMGAAVCHPIIRQTVVDGL